MSVFFGICLVVLWLFLLHILKKAKLGSWHFFAGAVGLFVLMMIVIRPLLSDFLARCVCGMSGVFGSLTNTFTAYFKYGIIHIPAASGSVTLMVDFECSGIIEIMAFLSLLVFFDVYSRTEKTMVGIIGVVFLLLCNSLRIIIIAEAVHFFGADAYYVAHTFIGRIFFYACSVLLYFYVFTKPQVVRMKVGNFTYGNNKQDT